MTWIHSLLFSNLRDERKLSFFKTNNTQLLFLIKLQLQHYKNKWKPSGHETLCTQFTLLSRLACQSKFLPHSGHSAIAKRVRRPAKTLGQTTHFTKIKNAFTRPVFLYKLPKLCRGGHGHTDLQVYQNLWAHHLSTNTSFITVHSSILSH